jgi:lipopolysaccharide/colanic/teichoic acid biosynthesis glycosyltransferase
MRQSGLSRLWISARTGPWFLASLVLSFGFFTWAAGFSRYAYRAEYRLQNLGAAAAFAFFFSVSGLGFGLFDREKRFIKLESLKLSLLSLLSGAVLSAALLQFLFFMRVGRISLAYGSLAAFSAVYAFHYLMGTLLSKVPLRFVVLGRESSLTEELLQYFSLPKTQRLHRHAQDLQLTLARGAQVWTPEEAGEFFAQSGVAELVLTRAAAEDPRALQMAIRALQSGVRVIDEASFYGEIFRCLPSAHLSTSWVTKAGFDVQRPMTNLLKRVFDAVGAVLGLVLASPVLVFIAVCVKFSSPGPVFFVQERQGRHFRPFKMIKFRTMRTDLTGMAVTSQRDPRVTWIGRIIRPLHFDELPQLVNILLGDMSFVGPRPAMISLVKTLREKHPIFEIRQMLRPGLTGLAQISQGYSLDTEEEILKKLGYDLYYLKNYGVLFDLWIMVKTGFNLARGAW